LLQAPQREAVQRCPNPGECCNDYPHGSGGAIGEPNRRDSPVATPRGSAHVDFSRGSAATQKLACSPRLLKKTFPALSNAASSPPRISRLGGAWRSRGAIQICDGPSRFVVKITSCSSREMSYPLMANPASNDCLRPEATSTRHSLLQRPRALRPMDLLERFGSEDHWNL
jgi:hypothetical protein